MIMHSGVICYNSPMQPNQCHCAATLAAAGLFGIVLLATLVGCGAGGFDLPGNGVPATDTSGHGSGDALYPKLPKVTGHIDRVDAQPDNPRYFSRLLITDAAGRSWEFRSEGWVGVSVGHLKEHRIQGKPVTVWYENGAHGGRRARFVGD